MKAVGSLSVRLILFLLLFTVPVQAQEGRGAVLSIAPGGALRLSWPSAFTNSASQQVFPEYSIEFSRDLRRWTPITGKVRGVEGRSGPMLTREFAAEPAPMFFRVKADPDSTITNRMGDGGAEVFGYNAEFDKEVERIGLLSVDDFATNAPALPYLPQITWDPTTAQFWTNFYTTHEWIARYGDNFSGFQVPYNFCLNDRELALFRTNGFVVSERLGTPTFGDAYYRLFNAELPVFITSDSVLHAWHRTYQSMLSELEELLMATMLEQLLTNMSAVLPEAWDFYGNGPLRDGILDADYFLTVARSLQAGIQVSNALSVAGEPERVRQTLAAIQNLSLANVPVFGTNRWVDFSQFRVRGHYDVSERMRRYFRAMMWCGRMDLRVATFGVNRENDIRQLGTAIVMVDLLDRSGQFVNWQQMEDITRTFVGITDSMTFPQLSALLQSAGILFPEQVTDFLTLTNLQTRLLTGELGVQNIHSDHFWSPLNSSQVRLPRSFTVTGQKFVMDSWSFSQVVFDRVLGDPVEWPGVVFGKVIRRKPLSLDVAFSVLGNSQAVPEIVERIRDTNGVPFRDGLFYQHNLLAVHNTIEKQAPAIWTNNIYTAWLGALRALSIPSTYAFYPQAMRTRAWAMKDVNTQLASWTELRHDTVLYAKQSYSEPLLCGYPAGFIEPRPGFWLRMNDLAVIAANAISRLPLVGEVTVPTHSTSGGGGFVTIDLAQIKAAQLSFLAAFSAHMLTLSDMASRELAQQPFTIAQTEMLKDVVERTIDYVGRKRWTGWYPKLYYTNALNRLEGFYGSFTIQAPECDIWDSLATDVHTDLPDEVVGDPGAVIHEAVGNVHILLIAVDNGPDRMVYAGPVFSHYEFEMPMGVRLSDADWKSVLTGTSKPASPEWTRSYLVPDKILIPPGY